MPSGKYLMEDLYYAGGLPVVLRELQEAGQLFGDALTVNGRPIGENNTTAECYNRDVVYPYSKPLQEAAGIAVLRVRRGAVGRGCSAPLLPLPPPLHFRDLVP